jgi:hypothetical protein
MDKKIVHQVFTTKLENALKKLGEKLDKATISLQSLISLKDKTERGKKTRNILPATFSMLWILTHHTTAH